MEAAIVKRDLHVGHGITGQHSAFERLDDPGFGRLDVLFGNLTARNIVIELETRPWRQWFDPNLHVRVLAVAAGLLGVLLVAFGFAADRLPISYLRLADISSDVELALQAVDDDLQVQL